MQKNVQTLLIVTLGLALVPVSIVTGGDVQAWYEAHHFSLLSRTAVLVMGLVSGFGFFGTFCLTVLLFLSMEEVLNKNPTLDDPDGIAQWGATAAMSCLNFGLLFFMSIADIHAKGNGVLERLNSYLSNGEMYLNLMWAWIPLFALVAILNHIGKGFTLSKKAESN